MAKFGTEARLGLVIMTAFLIFIWGTMKVTHIGEARGYDINAVFENASGLETNAPVRMVGVGVGRVKSIFIRDRKAFVTMTINEDVRIDRDASFAIRSQGILGDKYVEIQPGSSEGVYKSGDTVVTTKMPVDLESLMESLQSAGESLTKILTSLEKVVASDEGERSLAEILENTRKLSANLDLLISENREDVRVVIKNIREASEGLKDDIPRLADKLERASDQVTGLITDNREGVRDTVEKLRRNAEILEETLESIKTISKRIEEGEGTVGKLINEDEAYENLNETLGSLKRVLKKTEQIQLNIDMHGHYLTESDGIKGYVTLDINPTPDKFYRLELIDDPEGLREVETRTVTETVGSTTTVTQTEEIIFRDKFKFSLELGKRYYNTIFRLGYVESSFGFGIDRLHLNDGLKFSFDAWDVDRDENPRLRLKMSYRFLKFFHLDFGIDDFIHESRNPNILIGGGLKFVDDDLKYVISGLGFP